MMRFKGTTHCERCGIGMLASRMSRFNTQVCCLPCIDKEEKHPMYPQAEAAELAAIERGDYNYPGIGKPDDL